LIENEEFFSEGSQQVCKRVCQETLTKKMDSTIFLCQETLIKTLLQQKPPNTKQGKRDLVLI